MKYLVPILLCLSVVSRAFPADLKVGLVDLRRAFAEYYKSKDASTTLQSHVSEAKEQINERFAKYKALMDEIQKLDKEVEKGDVVHRYLVAKYFEIPATGALLNMAT